MNRTTLTPNVSLSRIVYGMWRLGDDADTSPAHIQAKVEACLAQGITTMDQADIYGGYAAEELFGACLRASPGLRDRIEIVTKCDIVAPMGRYADAPVKYYDTSRAHILASVDHSLRLMGIETIDLLLIHRPDPLMDAGETGEALDAVVASGKVKSVGVSNFRPWDWQLLQSRMQTQLVTNQIEISLLERTAFTNGDLAFLQQHRIAPMAWSPLGGGALFDSANKPVRDALEAVAAENGVDDAAVAIAFLLAHPARILPVMGTNRLDRIATFGDALKVKMDRRTWFTLYTAALGEEVP
ncbi:MAG: aldo/keto reductase [Pseudomonadota bacterium]